MKIGMNFLWGKQMMKRVVSAVLISAMVLSLSACGKSATSYEKDNPATEGAVNEVPYNIVIEWISVGNTPTEENLQKIETAINEITVPKIGCTVTLYPIEFSSLASDTALAISSGEKLDLICNLGGPSSAVTAGQIVPLTSYLDEYGANIKSRLGDTLTGGSYDGELWGVPVGYIKSEKYGFQARTDLLEKYNIKIDSNKLYTLEELGEIFDAIGPKEGSGFHCIAGNTSTSDVFTTSLGTLDTLGGSTDGATGALMLGTDIKNTKIQNIFASEQYKNYANLAYDWAQKGYIPNDAASNTDHVFTQLSTGNFLGTFYWTTEGASETCEASSGYKYTPIEIVPPVMMSANYSSLLWSVPITSENPQKAFQFLDLLYGDNDIDTILQFGLEGETWKVIDSDNQGNRLIDFVDGYNASTAPFYCYAGVYGDRLSWPVFKPNAIDLNSKLRAFNESVTTKSPALGYSYKITDAVSAGVSAVSAVISQYAPIISAGSVNPEKSLADFNLALETAGINEIIADNQSQLDEWLSKQ